MKTASENAEKYAKTKNRTIQNSFGYGKEGYVLQTTAPTAVKAFYYIEHYRHELEVYRYLKQWKIDHVAEFRIPEFIGCSESLRVIEMSIVSPPYILDFAEAAIEMEFDRDEGWENAMKDLFEDDWNRVKIALWKLEEHGIYLYDVHPGNVRCR